MICFLQLQCVWVFCTLPLCCFLKLRMSQFVKFITFNLEFMYLIVRNIYHPKSEDKLQYFLPKYLNFAFHNACVCACMLSHV